jgi:hypothetical protein
VLEATVRRIAFTVAAIGWSSAYGQNAANSS